MNSFCSMTRRSAGYNLDCIHRYIQTLCIFGCSENFNNTKKCWMNNGKKTIVYAKYIVKVRHFSLYFMCDWAIRGEYSKNSLSADSSVPAKWLLIKEILQYVQISAFFPIDNLKIVWCEEFSIKLMIPIYWSKIYHCKSCRWASSTKV